MTVPAHAFLLDLLASHRGAAAHGCRLEPRLLALLLEAHALSEGTIPLGRAIRHAGPLPAGSAAGARLRIAPSPAPGGAPGA